MIKPRTMKENALYDEVRIIRELTGRVDPYDHRRQRAIRIMGSSEIAKAILRKKGYTPESNYKK